MANTSSEDTIILLDTSRSMFRKQFNGQSRLSLGIQAITEYINQKRELDKSDRYSVVTFSGSVKQQNEMQYDAESILKFIEDQAEFEHGTSFGEALASALRIIVSELRKIGEKTIRILILSDGISLMSKMNPLNVAKIARQLGIIIDTIRFGPAKVPGNILKRVTEVTKGDYFFAADPLEFKSAIKKVSEKKEQYTATIFDKNNDNGGVSNELLSEIAGELLKLDELTPEQKFKIFKGKKDEKLKCSICYSSDCPMCETSFYGCGRFCPNCLTPMHLHCAIEWSNQQNKQNGNGNGGKHKIFRCVHCFYLLRIPVNTVATCAPEDGGTGDKTAVKIPIDEADPEVFKTVCSDPDCGIMFDDMEDDNVYKCNNCSSYFHEDCFEDYYNKNTKCPACQRYVKIKK